uniref:Envelope protein Mab3 n=1 Tax=Mabuya sp. NRPS-2014 TaxID=1496371 RepID=A0A2H4RC06_9SAUR|nr:envelope protein Mab3 [Mabuya sp. NRPS-2014]
MLIMWWLLVLMCSSVITVSENPVDPPLATRLSYNIWTHLAQITNVSTFCLARHTDAQLLLSTCLIPVCTAPEFLRTHTIFKHITIKHKYHTYPSWGTPTYQLPADATSFYTPLVANHANNTCVRMTGCQERKPAEGCLDPGMPQWNCTVTESVVSSTARVPLPAGWFFTCGAQTFNYIPDNLADVICCLSRLTVYLPQKHTLKRNTRAHRALRSTALSPDCSSDIHLLSKAEYISLAVSLIGLPGLAIGNAKTISKVACSLAKTINATSTAISALNREQQQLRHTVLDNRAALDYLLLLHNKGCEVVNQVCCFNLTDQSHVVSNQIQQLHILISQITENSNWSWWGKLWSWLPNMTWFKGVLGGLAVIMLMCMIIPCLIPCFFQNVQNMIQRTTQLHTQHIMLDCQEKKMTAKKNLFRFLRGENVSVK